MTTTPHDSARDIRIIRVYDAPLAVVWDAWADPAHIAQWWGPRGFTITTHHKELRVGGTWDYTMHGPDGVDWPNFTRYHEVVPFSRLVYDHGASSAEGAPLFRMTVQFRDLGGKTELDICMTLATTEAAQQTRAFIKHAGGNTTWDRLAEHVERRLTGSEIFVIARNFDAPIESVFDAWTTPERLAQWLPPTGFAMRVHRADVRAGGDLFFSMASDAFTMYGRMNYVALVRPHILEYLQCFTDANERVIRHPGTPVWPELMHTVVHFAEEGPSQTRVTVRFEATGAFTADEIAAVVAERAGMTKGWTGSFDALEALLTGVATGA
jgi:uncharacterized protein YndB with AHSA1/START domain